MAAAAEGHPAAVGGETVPRFGEFAVDIEFAPCAVGEVHDGQVAGRLVDGEAAIVAQAEDEKAAVGRDARQEEALAGRFGGEDGFGFAPGVGFQVVGDAAEVVAHLLEVLRRDGFTVGPEDGALQK